MFFYYLVNLWFPCFWFLLGISECNITQCDKCQCYVAPGEPLIFYLPIQNARIKLMKDKEVLFRCGNNTCTESTFKYIKSCEFLINGAVKCDHIIINESGVYQMDLYGNDGKSIKTINISLQITGGNIIHSFMLCISLILSLKINLTAFCKNHNCIC